MKALRIFTVLVGLTINLFAAEDTLSNLAIAADQFLQVCSIQETIAVSLEKIGQTMPQPKRDILESIVSHLDIQAVTQVMRQSLIENFTADDLHALRDFWGTPAGKPILEKLNSGRFTDLSAREFRMYNDFFGTAAGRLILEKLRKYQAEFKLGLSRVLRTAVLRALPEIVRRAGMQ